MTLTLVPRPAARVVQRRKRIVILGGGFAGVYTAKRLEKRLRGRDDVEIVLVSKENYFVFQPLLPEILSGQIGLTDVVSPLRRLVQRTDVHVRDVEAIDLAARTVTLAPGFQAAPHVVSWDHLVLALGSVTDFRGMRGLPDHAFPFKNLADALHVRNHVIRALEEAAIEHDDPDLRQRLLTFVVAGGGFSGVEVAAELNDFVRGVVKSYRSIEPSELRVYLVHSQDRILPEMPEKLAAYAARILQRRGVELVLTARLAAATADAAILSDGRVLPTRTLISTVPAHPHPLLESLRVAKAPGGRLLVDAHLQVAGRDDVWALGDCASVPDPGGGIAPPTAQHAVRQGRVCADNIVAALDRRALSPMTFRGLGKMGSLGRRSAVAEIFGLRISGFAAWFLWRTIYLLKLPGWGRRAKVAASWTFDLFLQPELVQLRLQGSSSITQAHFEPGEAVFREGDLGECIYFILRGRADVMQQRDDGERSLARLGPGEVFGEMALLAERQRSATVRCVEPMDVLVLTKRDFGRLAAYVPALRSQMEAVMRARIDGA